MVTKLCQDSGIETNICIWDKKKINKMLNMQNGLEIRAIIWDYWWKIVMKKENVCMKSVLCVCVCVCMRVCSVSVCVYIFICVFDEKRCVNVEVCALELGDKANVERVWNGNILKKDQFIKSSI